MAPSNGEIPNYTSKKRLGAVYFIPIYGTLDYIFNVLDPGYLFNPAQKSNTNSFLLLLPHWRITVIVLFRNVKNLFRLRYCESSLIVVPGDSVVDLSFQKVVTDGASVFCKKCQPTFRKGQGIKAR